MGSSLILNGNAEFNQQINVTGTANLNDNLTVLGETTLSNMLNVSGTAVFNDTVTVTGTATLSNDLNVNGLIALQNTTNAESASSGSLAVAGGVGIAQDVYIGQNLYVQGARPVLPASFGDLQETTVAFLANVASRSIAGFIFPTANVNSFYAQVTVNVTLSAGKLNAQFELTGTQAASGWVLNQKAIGDVVALGVIFNIASDGQIKYTAPSITNFSTGSIKFRANTTTVDGVYTANTSGSIALNYSPLDIGSLDYTICQPLAGTSSGSLAMTIGQKRVYLGNADQSDPTLPLDSEANHGGLVLRGRQDHYFLYDMETQSWITSDNLNIECDNGLYICDNKVLDANKLKIGSRLNQGEIYLGSGEHNTWKIATEPESGDLAFMYRKLDGSWVTKQTFALNNTDTTGLRDTAGNMISYYIEKRGEPLTFPQVYSSGTSGSLSHSLRLSTDDVIVGGRIMKKSVNFEGTWPGPLFKVKPGDTLNLAFKNDIDDFGDLADWNIGPMTEYHKHLHAHIDEDAEVTNWMVHTMPRGMTNLHFHGIHASPQGLGDNVFRMNKPGSILNHSYPIPSDHPGGLYFYHPHAHGESMNMIGRGAAGLIFIEGPYQTRVNNANVQRQFLAFGRLNWKNEAAHDYVSWYDYTAALPTDIYNPNEFGVPQALDAFVPTNYQGPYKFNSDVGKAGGCACGAGTTTHCGVNGCRTITGEITPCGLTDVKWLPLINGQIQPIITIQPGELQVWDYINTTTITFSRFAVEGHDIILVGKDGVPNNISSPDLASAPLDPDFVNTPAGVRLNYFINTSAQRFEFFVVPKAGVTPVNGNEFNVLLQTVEQTELFFNDTEAQTPPAHDYLDAPIPAAGGALEADIVIAKVKYSGSALSSGASNHISKVGDLLPSVASDSTAIPQEDLKEYSYVFAQDYPGYAADWKQDFTITAIVDDGNGKTKVTFDNTGLQHHFHLDDRLHNTVPVQISGTANYNGTFDVLSLVPGDKFSFVLDTPFIATETSGSATYNMYTMETQTLACSVAGASNPTVTCVEPHKLVAGNPVSIGGGVYTVNSVTDAYAFTITTVNDLTPETSMSYETINVQTEYFFHYSKALPNLTGKIAARRLVWFAFNPNPTETGISTWMDGGHYDEAYRLQAHLDTTEEWIMQNWTEVIHVFHIHVNNYQVCAYRDANFGLNVNGGAGYVDKSAVTHTLNPVSTYSNEFLERDIPFNGYEDSTSIPVAQGDPNATAAGVVDATAGHRGEVRIRHTFKDYTGAFFMHCHLLDDQDMGMMKIVEILGNGYTPMPNMDEIPDTGYLTTYQGTPI